MKIKSLEIENVKRVKAVELEPSLSGLTVIGGNNKQGKTSVLDSIAWALGGNKYKPSNPQREGSVLPPSLKVELSNGLIVKRDGKNSDLKVIDPSGQKAGQSLLDSFISELALDLPKFMEMNNKDKAKTLLKIIGVEAELSRLEKDEQTIYNRRYEVGRIAEQKKKYADELTYYPEAPIELVSASELIQRQQAILIKNGENQKHRNNLSELLSAQERDREAYRLLESQIDELIARKNNLGSLINTRAENIEAAQKTVDKLIDESTLELEEDIKNVEEINVKVRANASKEQAEREASDLADQYRELSDELEAIRKAKFDLLNNANLPLPELSVEDGELVYKGFKWDGMSGAERLKVAAAIVRKLKPECQFVLMDKLEQLDLDSLKEFNNWLIQEDLQVIATRVSKGDECSIIIEDGYVLNNEKEPSKEWKAGEF